MPGKPKGLPKTGGRKKGSPNKFNVELKDMIRGALDDVGGQKYLAEQAILNPVGFMGLVGKILPKDMNVSGDLAAHLVVEVVKFAESQNPK